MSEKRREIYARVGVQLTQNRRAFRAERACPGAMGLYLFAVLHTRSVLEDGFVSEEILLTAWGVNESVRGPQLDALVAVDLLERADGGFRVVKYAEHNDTLEEIESLREATRVRVRSMRDRKRESTPPGNAGVTRYIGVSNADVPTDTNTDPDPDQISDQDQLHRSPRARSGFPPEETSEVREVQGPMPDSKRAPEALLGAANGIPEPYQGRPAWADVAIEAVEANTGEKFDRSIVWVTYQGSREASGRDVGAADLRRFLGSWASKQKDLRARQRDRGGGGPRGDRQPHDTAWLKRLPSGTDGDF